MNNENVENQSSDLDGLTIEEIRKKIFVNQSDEVFKESRLEARQGILDGLLIPGLYILGGASKMGKSMIATALTNAVAKGESYLGRSNIIGDVMYFDNDNFMSETSNRVHALGFDYSDKVTFVFEEYAKSFEKIKYAIEIYDKPSELKLVIIDSLIGLSDYSQSEKDYSDTYKILEEIKNYMYSKGLICVLLHHTKKGEAGYGDELLGSRGLTGATTGTIILKITNDKGTRGRLIFTLRHAKEIIEIQKDKNGVGWILAPDKEEEEELDPNIRNVIHAVVLKKEKKIHGTCQEVSAKIGLTFNPMMLTKKLNENKKVLDDNHVHFANFRKKSGRYITIYSIDYPEEPIDEFCPICGNKLTVKEGNYGTFIACIEYPTCDYIKENKKDEEKPKLVKKNKKANK